MKFTIARHSRHRFVVPLSELHGPDQGEIHLPRRLYWQTQEGLFTLDDVASRVDMAAAVIDAADSEADLRDYLNARLLLEHWHLLPMDMDVRATWEAVNPELRDGERLRPR